MIRAIVTGFATTFKHMFRKPITVNYPDEKVPMFPKYRGKQVLMRDENGLEKCVACGLCAVACPADAIYLEAAENDGTVQAGPRYATVYQIHKTRCIFCGYCEEACPVSAIFMGKDYETAVYSNKDFIWDKTDMLVPADRRGARTRRALARESSGKPQHLRPTLPRRLDARVLVCDGAMGTMLYARGVFVNRCFDALNLTQPDLVAEVHREYVRAGADVIETNTFGANRFKLGTFGLADKLHDINLAGARIAQAGRARRRVRRRSHRPAQRPHRAVGPDGRRRGGGRFREQVGRARRGRRRPLRPRDVSRLSTRSAPRLPPSARRATCRSSRR